MSDDPWFWLSFADPNLPEGSQFLGALILQAPSFEEVIALSHLRGLNPGGEVQGVEIPTDVMDKFPDGCRERLLSREEAERL
jgi:hypothetical protein